MEERNSKCSIFERSRMICTSTLSELTELDFSGHRNVKKLGSYEYESYRGNPPLCASERYDCLFDETLSDYYQNQSEYRTNLSLYDEEHINFINSALKYAAKQRVDKIHHFQFLQRMVMKRRIKL